MQGTICKLIFIIYLHLLFDLSMADLLQGKQTWMEADMGLDAVELIMAVEEEFDILFDDKRLWECYTVGQLTDYTYELLQPEQSEKCRSLVTFNAIRKILVEDFQVDRDKVQLDKKITQLLPRDKVIFFYEKLEKVIDRVLIEKCFPVKFQLLIIALVILMIWAFASISLSAAIITNIFLLSFCLVILLYENKRRVVCRYKTIAEICNSRASSWRKPKITKEEIFEKIKEITIDQLGVRPEAVTWDARFVKDLGCD